MNITSIATSPPAVPRRTRRDSRERRRLALFQACRRQHPGCDAILICDARDIHYLTGVHEGISWLIVSSNGTIAVTRHMLIREVCERIPECEVLLPSVNSTDRPDVEAFVVAQLRIRSLTHILIETSKINAATYLCLAEFCSEQEITLDAASRMVAGLRVIKDDEELLTIRRCVDIAEGSLEQLISGGAAGLLGRTEREVAVELERIMIDLGADRQGFPGTGIIIASGPNSASNHHNPGSRRIGSGDTVLIDWGAERGGYRSDLTRTFFIHYAPDYALAAYSVVEDALSRAVSLLGPGQSMGAIDEAARQTIVSAGFPEFHYGVGHGVGLGLGAGCKIHRRAGEGVNLPEPVRRVRRGLDV